MEKETKGVELKKRPDTLFGKTIRKKTGLGSIYITINELNGKPVEVFVSTGKCGQSIMAKAESVGRLVSLGLRRGIEVEAFIRQLKGIAGDHPLADGHELILSIPDAVARVLENLYGKKTDQTSVDNLEIKES